MTEVRDQTRRCVVTVVQVRDWPNRSFLYTDNMPTQSPVHGEATPTNDSEAN